MHLPDGPERALGRIPGWEDASHKELSGGLTNRTWVVEAGHRRGVLKIDEKPRSAPYNSRTEEARIQAIAADAGLANKVLYVDETVYLTEYVDGETWSREQFDRNDNLVELAHSLRRLHALPLTGRSFDARAAAQLYVQRIDDADPALVERYTRVVESMRRPKNLCCCHNDLVADNIISTPGVSFLDWEYACDNDPFFDLATVVAHHGLAKRQAELLLDAYFDGDGARWRKQLAEQQQLYDALNWLWAAARR